MDFFRAQVQRMELPLTDPMMMIKAQASVQAIEQSDVSNPYLPLEKLDEANAKKLTELLISGYTGPSGREVADQALVTRSMDALRRSCVLCKKVEPCDNPDPKVPEAKQQDQIQILEVDAIEPVSSVSINNSTSADNVNVESKSATQVESSPVIGLNRHKRCARCKRVMYDTKECQRLHWRDHKLECKAAQVRAKAPGRSQHIESLSGGNKIIFR